MARIADYYEVHEGAVESQNYARKKTDEKRIIKSREIIRRSKAVEVLSTNAQLRKHCILNG